MTTDTSMVILAIIGTMGLTCSIIGMIQLG